MSVPILTYDEMIDQVDWIEAMEAIKAGHRAPRAQMKDMFLGPANATLLSRGAYIEGMGYGVKSVTVFDGNSSHGLPTVQGSMLIFEPQHGQLSAIIESRLITYIKTASDSVLGAKILARPDSQSLLIVGAGTVAHSLIDAYSAAFPNLNQIWVWARRQEQAAHLASQYENHRIKVQVASNLGDIAPNADMISCATMAREPVLKGDWINSGAHIDLIGAYKRDMREADDTLMVKGSIFVDSRDTTIHHIGEITSPIERGVIAENDIQGDFYDLLNGGAEGRNSEQQITIFKNGGGAHLDLMIAQYIISKNADKKK